jgi:hypothetical protein
MAAHAVGFAFVSDFDQGQSVQRKPDLKRDPLQARVGSSLVEFLSKMGGRDKMARFSQYLLKVLVPMVEAYYGGPSDLSKKMNSLSSGFGAGRRFMRLGNLPAQFQEVQKASELAPLPSRTFALLSKISSVCFTLIDNSEWASRLGTHKMDYNYWAFYSAVTWFCGSFFGALVNVYDCSVAHAKEQACRARLARESGDTSKLQQELRDHIAAQKRITVDFLRNAFDAIMASNGVRKYPERVPQWIFPVFGLISSCIGTYQAWPAVRP